MALLDLQNMEPDDRNHGGGGGDLSTVSLIGCVSAFSVIICL